MSSDDLEPAIKGNIAPCDLLFDRERMAEVQQRMAQQMSCITSTFGTARFSTMYGLHSRALVLMNRQGPVLINGYGIVADAQCRKLASVKVSAVFPVTSWQMDLVASADLLDMTGTRGLAWFYSQWQRHTPARHRMKDAGAFLGMDGAPIHSIRRANYKHKSQMDALFAMPPLDCSLIWEVYREFKSDRASAVVALRKYARRIPRPARAPSLPANSGLRLLEGASDSER